MPVDARTGKEFIWHPSSPNHKNRHDTYTSSVHVKKFPDAGNDIIAKHRLKKASKKSMCERGLGPLLYKQSFRCYGIFRFYFLNFKEFL